MKLWLDVATAAAKSVLPSLRPFLGFKAWKAASAFIVSPKHWKTSVNSWGTGEGREGYPLTFTQRTPAQKGGPSVKVDMLLWKITMLNG